MLIRFDGGGIVELNIIKIAFEINVVLRPALLENFDDLARALVSLRRTQIRTGQVGGNDIDGQSPAQDVVKRSNGTSQHRRMYLATTNRRQDIDIGSQWRDCRGKGQRILPDLIRGRTQYITITQAVSRQQDVGGIAPIAFVTDVVVSEKFVVAIAQGGKPCDFCAL